jgi:hypothetical protein
MRTITRKKQSKTQNQHRKKEIEELSDSYIIRLLTRTKVLDLQRSDITPEMIELKRQIIVMERNLRRLEETKKESGEHGKKG